MDPPDRPPRHGVRFVLELDRSADRPLVYRGRLELGAERVDIEVRVEEASSADGLAATASAPGAPERERAGLERLAAAMARSAVRTARRTGQPPPRRIQRWRPRGQAG